MRPTKGEVIATSRHGGHTPPVTVSDFGTKFRGNEHYTGGL